MIRPLIAATLLALTTTATLAQAQTATQVPEIQVQAGFQPQTRQVTVAGERNVADSAILRARGCTGFVAVDPSVSITYNDQSSAGAVVIRAESATDLVLLVGTSTGAWFCNDNAVGTNPEITLPPGSGFYSVWVGTAQRGRANATVRVTEIAGGRSAQVSGRCGSDTARIPMSMASEDWSQFSCMSQEMAGAARWSSCVGRATYSDFSKDGCPGAELCCPAEGFNLAASQQRARTQNAAAASTTTATTTTRPSTTTGTTAGTTSPASGSTTTATTTPATTTSTSTTGAGTSTTTSTPSAGASTSAPVLEANPFGVRPGALTIFWRGFESAKLPVYSEPRAGASKVFDLDATSFPIVVRDTVLTVKTPRRLRARSATTLTSTSGNIAVSAGQEIELLALAAEGTCHVRASGNVQVAQCPTPANFDGVTESFMGHSAIDYEWWVAVESPSRQRGWVRIDLQRPEFVVTLPPR